MKKAFIEAVIQGVIAFLCTWAVATVHPVLAAIYPSLAVAAYVFSTVVNYQTLKSWEGMYREAEERLAFANGRIAALEEDMRDLQSQIE